MTSTVPSHLHAQIVSVLSAFPAVIAIHVRDPTIGDAEYSDVTLYVEVRPFDNTLAADLGRELLPVLGETGGVHVQSADHPHSRLLVGTRAIWRR
jgi:hypothetical protein